ncbi:MAG: GntR family transcriptional regulator [Bryobacteraceae bacterium]
MPKEKEAGHSKRSASREAELYLKRILFEGRLKPRERVIEEEVARSVHCSRGPVREAVLRLEREGLLLVTQRRGIFVRDVSREDLSAIFRIRGKLEGLCARYLHESHLTEGESLLKQCLAEMKTAAAKRDEGALLRADMKLHRSIWRLSGQEYLYRILGLVMNPMIFMIARTYASRVSTPEEMYKDHEQYVRLILETPVARVERKVEQYFETLHRNLDRAVFSPTFALTDSGKDIDDPLNELIGEF